MRMDRQGMEGLARNGCTGEKWIELGCGDEPYNCPKSLLPPAKEGTVVVDCTFAVDGKCPAKMPDLKQV